MRLKNTSQMRLTAVNDTIDIWIKHLEQYSRDIPHESICVLPGNYDLSKMSLMNPFKMEVAQKLEKISHLLFGTWIVGMLGSAHSAWLMKLTGQLYGNWVSGEFIFMAGLVFIISQVFKRGVEIQSENELTV